VAIAGTQTAARLLVRHRAGLTVIEPGTEAETLAALPIRVLAAMMKASSGAVDADANADAIDDLVRTFRRWGLHTLGDVAALPPQDVAARLGQNGVVWQRVARGEDARPLVPSAPEERFEQTLDLEWPIDGLEPLSFVLGRLMDPLAAHLDRRGRGAAVLHVRLRLVRSEGLASPVHERSLQLPTPIRDARTLRTLALLDLESHPPAAAIECVTVAVDPTPARIVQFSLLTRPLPSPDQVSTLLARLTAVMGEGRCGSPADVDSWMPGAFTMRPFAPVDASVVADVAATAPPSLALRRFRQPVPARVRVEDGAPARVSIDRPGLSGGRVETCAGPWRTSGQWWAGGASGVDGAGGASGAGAGVWDRDEWDVTLTDGATYRLFRERHADAWFVDGVVD